MARGVRAAACLVAMMATAAPVVVRAAHVDCEIEGVVDKDILKNVEATLSIIRDKDRDDLTPVRIQQLHERAPMEIQRAVEPFGYYRATVQATLTPGKDEKFQARYLIELGEPVRVQRASVSVTGEGKDQPPFPTLVAQFPLRPGDILDQRRYAQQKNAFATTAADSGYLDAKFTASVIRIHREENVADIDLVLDTGPQYKFGPVMFDSTSVDERVLRTYLTFKRGEPFRYGQLLAFQSRLGAAPYFSRVEAVPRRDLVIDHELPIQVKFTTRRPRRYEIGAGYGTDTGPRILLNVEFRRLNQAGHRYSGRFNLSEIEISLNAEYTIPSLYPDTHTYSIGALIAQLDPVAYKTTRLAVGPTRSQPRFGWLESITVSYEHEDFSVGSDDGVTNLIIAGVRYRLKRSDDDISPTRGHRLDVGLRGSQEEVFSSQTFWSLTGSAKVVRTPMSRVRFVGRVDGGATTTPTFRELPPTVRFFAGGDSSVRGYEYESLGPRDEGGQVIGGRYLLTSSAELVFQLKGKLGLAAFYDAGNAFASVGEGIMEQGIGTGLRWGSPVGPIRFDVAFPVHHNDWEIHFTMGPDL